ncbi:MAG TPA: hypothetical protein VJB57_11700 [Dehalococcoidia bacterium]|nr:hypothetical protein [Dehalococcoidia bacterium]
MSLRSPFTVHTWHDRSIWRWLRPVSFWRRRATYWRRLRDDKVAWLAYWEAYASGWERVGMDALRRAGVDEARIAEMRTSIGMRAEMLRRGEAEAIFEAGEP